MSAVVAEGSNAFSLSAIADQLLKKHDFRDDVAERALVERIASNSSLARQAVKDYAHLLILQSRSHMRSSIERQANANEQMGASRFICAPCAICRNASSIIYGSRGIARRSVKPSENMRPREPPFRRRRPEVRCI